MMERPDPDALLRRVQAEEERAGRGRLKIFLGYAAGVGKTYAMLEAAHQRKAEGVDVAAGYVETHGRAETEALLRDLEVLPPRQVAYRNVTLPELDGDALLARRPQLALVDELAHTNAPGMRHPKRYQDVEELLAAGINVYTTLNVQHLESLNDVVAQITGTRQRETVPDQVLDEAAEIEMVDLPPDELLARLREGKVYIPDQAARAIALFFRKGNLTALREMALRRTAERVDDQMRAYMQTRAIPGPWHASERLLVCVSASPSSERLVRSARRLADELNAPWYALHFESATHPDLRAANRQAMTAHLQLAESLGAETVTVTGDRLADAVLDFAKQHNVTKIVIGSPVRSRWRDLLRVSLVEDLVRLSGDIDVHVISEAAAAPRRATRRLAEGRLVWRRYALSVALIAGATIIGWPLRARIEPANLVMPYLVAVLIAALYLGRMPAVLSAALGVLAFDFFLVPPYLTLAVSDTQYVLTFLGLFLLGLVVSGLAARARDQALAAVRREMQTVALYDLSRTLTSATDLTGIVAVVINQVEQVFARGAVVFMPHTGGLRPFAGAEATGTAETTEHDLAVATWAFEHGRPAGRGTDTLPAAQLRCLPMLTPRGPIGVLGIRPSSDERILTTDQQRTLNSFTNQAALAIERAQLVEKARAAELLQVTEKLQRSLLDSVSHELRTPLVTITGALSALEEDGARLDAAAVHSLVAAAREEAERLNRLVANLLSMTRLEAGAMHLALQDADVEDLVGSALDMLGPRSNGRRIETAIPPDLPMVPVDFVLIVQVLVNVLDNAIKYSPTETPIRILAGRAGGSVYIGVTDRGSGIPTADLDRVFDKFYRVQRQGDASGTGLGLSICRGIVEAHGGRIWAEAEPEGGAKITLSLPVDAR
jgi:two-component system sensor histidine kinase KdpD